MSKNLEIKTVDFDFVQEGLGNNTLIVVDVRPLEQRLEDGRIPGTCHVQFEQVARAFSVFATSADEFFAEFDFIRPSKEGSELPSLILTADDTSDTFEGNGVDLGVKASMVLHELGYRCIGVYPDGLSDWRMNGGQTLKGYDDEKKEMDFYEIRRGRADSSMVIIDVRTKAERQQHGAIKQTLHIPLNELWSSFKMRPDAFKARFDLEKKVLKEKQIVVHCLKGKRAFEAADKLLLLGYKNVYVYKGSFLDWTERRGSVAFDQPQTIRRFSLKRPEPTKNQLAALEALAAKANLQSTFVTEEDEEEEA